MHLLVSLTSSMVCGRRLGRRTTEMRGHRPCRGSFLLGIISLIVSLGWTAALTSSNETLVCTARHGCGLRGICGSHTVSGTCLCVRDLLYTNYPKCYEPLSWVRSVKATVFFALRLVNREWRLLLRLSYLQNARDLQRMGFLLVVYGGNGLLHAVACVHFFSALRAFIKGETVTKVSHGVNFTAWKINNCT